MQLLKIIVDNRERNLEIIDTLSGSGVDLTFAQLPVGDYIVSERMCIERKTVGDFENSIIDNRLFEQLERLKSGFEKPILILEGDQSEHRLANNVIVGTMIKLYTDYNVQIIRSHDAVETASILSKFADREQNADRKEPRILGLKKAHTTYQWQIQILSAMPGIGPSLAHRLLSHFGTLRDLANAEVKELVKVEKIGKKKAQGIHDILNVRFEQGKVGA